MWDNLLSYFLDDLSTQQLLTITQQSGYRYISNDSEIRDYIIKRIYERYLLSQNII